MKYKIVTVSTIQFAKLPFPLTRLKCPTVWLLQEDLEQYWWPGNELSQAWHLHGFSIQQKYLHQRHLYSKNKYIDLYLRVEHSCLDVGYHLNSRCFDSQLESMECSCYSAMLRVLSRSALLLLLRILQWSEKLKKINLKNFAIVGKN